MKLIHETAPLRTRKSVRCSGSSLIVALITITVLSIIAGSVLFTVSTRYNTTAQVPSWEEALTAAEAGADIAAAALQTSLTESNLWSTSTNALTDSGTAWGAWGAYANPNGKPYPYRSYAPATPLLTHSGEGGGKLYTSVIIDAPTSLKNGQLQWYRIRSTGTAEIAGFARTGTDKLENSLRRYKLRSIPPTVSRSIEVIAQPILPSNWRRAVTVTDSVAMNDKQTFDSYDSSSATKSTNGRYDVAKRQSHADIGSNGLGKDMDIGGAKVWGNVASNSGVPKNSQNVQGTATSGFTDPDIASVSAPTGWGSVPTTSIVKQNATLTGGSQSSPGRYKLSDFSIQNNNTVTLKTHAAGQPSYVEIWVTSDMSMSDTSSIVMEPGVKVTIYIEGKFSMAGNCNFNQTGSPPLAANVTLKGIKGHAIPSWDIGSTADFMGTVYAPDADVKVNGTAAIFYGAIVTHKFELAGGIGTALHFDESLLASGSTLPSRYQISSWLEVVQ